MSRKERAIELFNQWMNKKQIRDVLVSEWYIKIIWVDDNWKNILEPHRRMYEVTNKKRMKERAPNNTVEISSKSVKWKIPFISDMVWWMDKKNILDKYWHNWRVYWMINKYNEWWYNDIVNELYENWWLAKDSWVAKDLNNNWIDISSIKTMYYKKLPKNWEDWYTAFLKFNDWENIVDYTKEFETVASKYKNNFNFTKDYIKWSKSIIISITDEHIWLNPRWQYDYKYTEEIINEKVDELLNNVHEQYKLYWWFDRVVLAFLWDWLDWRQWQTTRWWHKLPQIYSSVEAFRIYVDFKLKIINNIYKLCKKLVVRNVCNSNHWWDFEMITNMAVEKAIWHTDVNYSNYDKFMNHIIIDKRCFIITHWKDDIDMKFWLPKYLNDKAVNFINNYITVNNLKWYKIVVLKWDLHCSASEKTKFFDYHNFLSFACPSKWVQHNFGDSLSWYSFMIFDNNSFNRIDFEIEYEKNLPALDVI